MCNADTVELSQQISHLGRLTHTAATCCRIKHALWVIKLRLPWVYCCVHSCAAIHFVLQYMCCSHIVQIHVHRASVCVWPTRKCIARFRSCACPLTQIAMCACMFSISGTLYSILCTPPHARLLHITCIYVTDENKPFATLR